MQTTVNRRVTRAFAGACLLGSMLLAADAHATVIDFESLANSGAGVYGVASPYSEDGFTLTALGLGTNGFVTFGTGEGRYGGSAALYNNDGGGVTQLTRDGGGLFGITSINLAKDARFGNAPITFVGTFADATTVTQSFTITSGTLSTFLFPSTFQGLTTLEWKQESPYHQFDDIVLSESGPTSVPDAGPSVALIAALWAAAVARARSVGA